MLARLSSADYPALRYLKTRDTDDFSIALLDASSVVLDILTFYQERLANESYLRTATQLARSPNSPASSATSPRPASRPKPTSPSPSRPPPGLPPTQTPRPSPFPPAPRSKAYPRRTRRRRLRDLRRHPRQSRLERPADHQRHPLDTARRPTASTSPAPPPSSTPATLFCSSASTAKAGHHNHSQRTVGRRHAQPGHRRQAEQPHLGWLEHASQSPNRLGKSPVDLDHRQGLRLPPEGRALRQHRPRTQSVRRCQESHQAPACPS